MFSIGSKSVWFRELLHGEATRCTVSGRYCARVRRDINEQRLRKGSSFPYYFNGDGLLFSILALPSTSASDHLFSVLCQIQS